MPVVVYFHPSLPLHHISVVCPTPLFQPLFRFLSSLSLSCTIPPGDVLSLSEGTARIYDDKFDLVGDIPLAGLDQASFVNDVIVTKTAAYFTDSFQPQIYSVGAFSNNPCCCMLPPPVVCLH